MQLPPGWWLAKAGFSNVVAAGVFWLCELPTLLATFVLSQYCQWPCDEEQQQQFGRVPLLSLVVWVVGSAMLSFAPCMQLGGWQAQQWPCARLSALVMLGFCAARGWLSVVGGLSGRLHMAVVGLLISSLL